MGQSFPQASPHLLNITLNLRNFPASPISWPLLPALAAAWLSSSPGLSYGCLCRALLPFHCSLPLPEAGAYLRTEIPDSWGRCLLGCQEGGEATLGTLRGVAPRLCPSPPPRAAHRENLFSRATQAALGPCLEELLADPWRLWWCFLHNQPHSGPLLRSFPLLHGEVLVCGCRVRTAQVYVFAEFFIPS